MKNWLYVFGTIHPRVEPAGYDGYFLCEDDVDHFINALRGKPVYIEHMTDLAVGTVMDVERNGLGGLDATLRLDKSDTLNESIRKKLETGKFEMFSLGHRVTESQCEKTGTLKIVDKTPSEVSIVKVGDRPGTYINAWEVRKCEY